MISLGQNIYAFLSVIKEFRKFKRNYVEIRIKGCDKEFLVTRVDSCDLSILNRDKYYCANNIGVHYFTFRNPNPLGKKKLKKNVKELLKVSCFHIAYREEANTQCII